MHNKIARKVFTEALLGGMERREAHSPSSKSSQCIKKQRQILFKLIYYDTIAINILTLQQG